MMRALIIFSFVLVFATAAAAQEKPGPTSPPPTIVLARAVEKDGKIEVLLSQTVIVPEERTVIVEKNGQKVQQVITVYVPANRETTLIADGKVDVTRKDGKKVDVKELPRLLTKQSPILMFEFGVRDPRYLEVVRDDALIFVVRNPLVSLEQK